MFVFIRRECEVFLFLGGYGSFMYPTMYEIIPRGASSLPLT